MRTIESIFNIAHRGARSLAPENTMSAFIKAYETGSHGIETDVRVTRDGIPILFHDEDLRRTTDIDTVYPDRKRASVHHFTYDELQQLDAGSWFFQKDPFKTVNRSSLKEEIPEKRTTIPTLEELLHFIDRKGLYLNLEIKQLPREIENFSITTTIMDLLKDFGLDKEQFAISSFNHSYLRKIQDIDKNTEINALIGNNRFLPQDWGNYEFAIYNANVKLFDLQQLHKAREKGCSVNLYTVNNPEEMLFYLQNGVGKIITDFPQILAEIQK